MSNNVVQKMAVHKMNAADTAANLNTDIQKGLSSAEVLKRQDRFGFNELHEKPRPGFFRLLLEQFNNFLVQILIVAAIVSIAVGEKEDSIAIIAIVILNAILGVVQESKAEKALAALKKMTAPLARVLRDGIDMQVPARELVPGDIVILEAGNYIPADLRLIESVNLKIEEAALTGESVPVEKNSKLIHDEKSAIGDRHNSAFMGTLITYGRGSGIVASTGMSTEMGAIAEMIQSVEDEHTPLQLKLAKLGKILGTVSLIICGFVFIYGIFRDTHLEKILTDGFMSYLGTEKQDITIIFMTAVSLAIAAVPEGLPAIVTICLALGMQKMVARNALIRKLPAVETLGCTTVICSDKTGTLTQNQMTVVRAWCGGKTYKVTGEGYAPQGEFQIDGRKVNATDDLALESLVIGSMLCNDARIEGKNEDDKMKYVVIGDPTEGALVVAAGKGGIDRDRINSSMKRVEELPFDSDRKMMTTVHLKDAFRLAEADHIAFVKGAPDIVLSRSTHIVENGKIVPITESHRKAVLESNTDMARSALRVLAVGFRSVNNLTICGDSEQVENDLVFSGLMGMIDPARSEVKDAVAVAKRAGIKSVMITGDYRDTAEAIAKEIGMSEGGRSITGEEIEKMSVEELVSKVESIDAYARVSPAHKMKIVDAFKKRGHIVAMTGDGVNDAPALKRANIGIAMGITGTDVAKETADMVLTDDNFASIISAVEEGRVIYSNIRKFVFFLVSCNISEIIVVFFSMLMGLPMPLQPIQLLMLNLVTDGAPALALGLERGDPDIMQWPPRAVDESIINKEMLIGIAIIPVFESVSILIPYYLALSGKISLFGYTWVFNATPGVLYAQTIAFATLVCAEITRAYSARSARVSIIEKGLFSNPWMIGASLLSFGILMITLYVPQFHRFFGTSALTLTDWAFIAPFILFPSVVAEIVKVFLRMKARRSRG